MSGEPTACEVCEAMCLDAVDGTLTAAEHAAYRAARGRLCGVRRAVGGSQAWSGVDGDAEAAYAGASSAIAGEDTGGDDGRGTWPMRLRRSPCLRRRHGAPSFVAVWRKKLASAFSFEGGYSGFQPRMVMTAAMAFFSLALTMNMSGIHVSDLRPSMLHRTVASASADAMRSFQSLRVVNQMESKVSELRQDERRDDQDPGGPFSGTSQR